MRSIFALVLVLCVACSHAKPDDEPSGLTDAQRAGVGGVRDSVQSWAETKEELGVLVRVKGGSDGDAVIFNGLLCASGDLVGCVVVKASQGPDGRVWRSPGRVGVEEVDSFSRDQLLGGLLYVVKTGDKDFLNRWRDWITDEGGLCKEDTDQRCRFTPITVALWNYVAARVDGAKLPLSIVAASDPGPRTVGFVGLPPAADISYEVLAKTTPAGFALHLLAIQIFVKRVANDWNGALQNAAKTLAKREPRNAFFRYLRDGVDGGVADLVIELAPKEKPAKTNQWSFEREDDESAWLASCGWEFIFIANLLLD